jgi:hypothetical protein
MTPRCAYTGETPASAPLPCVASKVMVTLSSVLGKTGMQVTWAAAPSGKSNSAANRRQFEIANWKSYIETHMVQIVFGKKKSYFILVVVK